MACVVNCNSKHRKLQLQQVQSAPASSATLVQSLRIRDHELDRSAKKACCHCHTCLPRTRHAPKLCLSQLLTPDDIGLFRSGHSWGKNSLMGKPGRESSQQS